METRKQSLKFSIIFILIAHSSLPKLGSCAPAHALQSVNNLQNVKLSPQLINYFNSIFHGNSFNYHDPSCNVYEPQHKLEPVYAPNIFQHMEDCENDVYPVNHNNWKQQDTRKFNYYGKLPNDLCDEDKDNSVTYLLENDSDCDSNSEEDNNLDWSKSSTPMPLSNVNEIQFHSYYLIPEERRQIYQPKTPKTLDPAKNLQILDCKLHSAPKEFLEKVLAGDNDEYMALVLKRNQYLGTQTAGSIQTALASNLQQTSMEMKANETKELPEIPQVVENSVMEEVDQDIVSSPKSKMPKVKPQKHSFSFDTTDIIDVIKDLIKKVIQISSTEKTESQCEENERAKTSDDKIVHSPIIRSEENAPTVEKKTTVVKTFPDGTLELKTTESSAANAVDTTVGVINESILPTPENNLPVSQDNLQIRQNILLTPENNISTFQESTIKDSEPIQKDSIDVQTQATSTDNSVVSNEVSNSTVLTEVENIQIQNEEHILSPTEAPVTTEIPSTTEDLALSTTEEGQGISTEKVEISTAEEIIVLEGTADMSTTEESIIDSVVSTTTLATTDVVVNE